MGERRERRRDWIFWGEGRAARRVDAKCGKERGQSKAAAGTQQSCNVSLVRRSNRYC
ncbi:hypothetical protein BGW36DRAFT_380739 [Talaromyces proteolyticus]|uniref:Uncharacterized protein n=1 Tax=Talaromyces proteolyticus TaxID=1131652 RepID=A0AAD4KQZ7_9EURO|nr:uncharacterized protein BGW36DRAFT_380739 [Talaromyces proteolyticus]KAH8696347.1 hypothetical protein BGW36DRAFT_380739 [Talaromyces proteolyticus]